MLQSHEDPFGAYAANDSTTIFSILPPLSILSPSQNLSRTSTPPPVFQTSKSSTPSPPSLPALTSLNLRKGEEEATPRARRELSVVSEDEESKTPTVDAAAQLDFKTPEEAKAQDSPEEPELLSRLHDDAPAEEERQPGATDPEILANDGSRAAESQLKSPQDSEQEEHEVQETANAEKIEDSDHSVAHHESDKS